MPSLEEMASLVKNVVCPHLFFPPFPRKNVVCPHLLHSLQGIEVQLRHPILVDEALQQIPHHAGMGEELAVGGVVGGHNGSVTDGTGGDNGRDERGYLWCVPNYSRKNAAAAKAAIQNFGLACRAGRFSGSAERYSACGPAPSQRPPRTPRAEYRSAIQSSKPTGGFGRRRPGRPVQATLRPLAVGDVGAGWGAAGSRNTSTRAGGRLRSTICEPTQTSGE